MPLFSTVIPTYNRASLIRATIDSVLAQDLPDQEVIVVDDGSTDGTLETLASYGNRIKVLEQKNSGPAVARNLGIAHASGEYIATLDSDDLWFPWTLAVYAEAIRAHGSPAFVAGAPFVFHDEAQVQGVRRETLRAERFKDYLASLNPTRQPAFRDANGDGIFDVFAPPPPAFSVSPGPDQGPPPTAPSTPNGGEAITGAHRVFVVMRLDSTGRPRLFRGDLSGGTVRWSIIGSEFAPLLVVR